MAWQQMVLLAYYTLIALALISSIGKPRGPITNGGAVASMIILGVIVYLTVGI
jgi:hypothetical protein